MKLRELVKKEKGSIPILVALSLTVLFGFTSLAVDFGMMASCRQSLQNAADAAALAAAGDLANGQSYAAVGTAKTYAKLNGFDPDREDISLSVQTSGKTVTVSIQREMTMGFSAVLTGERTRMVSATATAIWPILWAMAPRMPHSHICRRVSSRRRPQPTAQQSRPPARL